MATTTKRQLTDETRTKQTPLDASVKRARADSATPSPYPTSEDMSHRLALIASSPHTPFDKRVWSLLLQIPRGRVSTYGAMSTHLKSSPRAVGSAMRRNPFAPGVPCHRCVATGGKLGGFKGYWPREKGAKAKSDGKGKGRMGAEEGEKRIQEKTSLLRSEGVRIDSTGRVLGTPFDAFV